jgi:hypothetical protein
MTDKSWRRRAADMRLWATEVEDPYTRIEMIALAEAYEQRAERSAGQSHSDIRISPVKAAKLSRARCGRPIEPDWWLGGDRGFS